MNQRIRAFLPALWLTALPVMAAENDDLPIYAETCLGYLKDKGFFPDRDQVRVESHSRKWDNFVYADRKLTGQIATLSVNAKSSQGIYIGARSFTCQLSEDGRRVLKGP